MAQWIKVVAAKPADLNSIPWIHMVEREPAPEDCPLTSPPFLPSKYMQHSQGEALPFGDSEADSWVLPPSTANALGLRISFFRFFGEEFCI